MGFFILFYRWSLDQELILVFLLIFSVLGRIIHMFLRWACGLEQEGSDLFGLQEEWKLPGSFGDDFLCQNIIYFKIFKVFSSYQGHSQIVVDEIHLIKLYNSFGWEQTKQKWQENRNMTDEQQVLDAESLDFHLQVLKSEIVSIHSFYEPCMIEVSHVYMIAI